MPGDFVRHRKYDASARRLHGDGSPRADKREQARSAVNDVQRPFFDVERGFSDGFA